MFYLLPKVRAQCFASGGLYRICDFRLSKQQLSSGRGNAPQSGLTLKLHEVPYDSDLMLLPYLKKRFCFEVLFAEKTIHLTLTVSLLYCKALARPLKSEG